MDTNDLFGGSAVAPSNININGMEYSPDEAQSLIELGNKTRELEKQWNTPVDKVWPAYGESRNQLKSMETELAQARAEVAQFQAKQQQGVETPTDVTQAREAARKLGIPLNEDLEKSYVKREELDKYFAQKEQEREAVNQILDNANKLSKEIDGSDGRPKFNKKAVIAYANAYGHSDLTTAYEEMNEEQLKPWKDAQLAKNKSTGLKTLKPSGVKHEPTNSIPKGDDEFKALLRETLSGSDEGR